MPKDNSSLREIECALTLLASRDSSQRIYERLAQRAGVDLAPAESWLLLRLDEHASVAPEDLASRLDVPRDRLLDHLQPLREAGLVTDAGESRVCAIYEGRRVLDKLVAARWQGLSELLDGWSPEQHQEVTRLLGCLARELLRDEPEPGLATAADSSYR